MIKRFAKLMYAGLGVGLLLSCSQLQAHQMDKKYQVNWSLDGSFATYAVMKSDSGVLETSVSFARSRIDPSIDSYFTDKEGNILSYITSPTANGPWGRGARMHT